MIEKNTTGANLFKPLVPSFPHHSSFDKTNKKQTETLLYLFKNKNYKSSFYFFRGTKNRSLYVKFWGQEAVCKGELFFSPFFCAIISVKLVRFCNPNVFLQDMQVLSKVEASLEFSQVLLRSEAKNFTEVAALTCRGELAPFYYLSHHFPNNLIIPSKCDWFSAKHLEVFSITNSFVALTRFAAWG